MPRVPRDLRVERTEGHEHRRARRKRSTGIGCTAGRAQHHSNHACSIPPCCPENSSASLRPGVCISARCKLMPAVALVVDDSMLIRYTVCRFLEERGFAVESATNGVEALQILERVRPALIVTDMQMPKMTG